MRRKLAIFDLGQVCIRTVFSRCYESWERSAGMKAGTLLRQWEETALFKEYERGEIDCADFANAFCSARDLEIGFSDWEAGWNALFGETIGPTVETVRAMKRAGMRVVILSNTNANHCAFWRPKYAQFLESIDREYVSNEIGMRKPERRIYEYVIESESCLPEDAVFFDDRRDNIEMARACGIESLLFDRDSTASEWWTAHR